VTDRETRVAREIRRIAREDLGLAIEARDGDELAGTLDSLSLLSLVVAVEDRFRVKIDEEEAALTRSLEDLARLVAGKAQVAGEAAQ